METEQRQSNVYKKLFFILLLTATVGVVATGAYYIGKNQTKSNFPPAPTYGVPTLTASGIKQPSLSPRSEVSNSGDENVVPITPNTIEFARMEGKTYLRYRGKIYDDSDQLTPHVAFPPNPKQAAWYGLVNAPAFVSPGEFMYDELFGFKVAPDGQGFIFIMRWGDKNAQTNAITYSIYYYNRERLQKLNLVRKFVPGADGSFPIPKISQFSFDGKYLSFDMYACWNCGGSKPETLLMKLADNSEKRIGRTSYFAWKENGAYEFKEYTTISCPPTPSGGEVMIGECSEKPENLPLKTGQF